jgi:hypothetical protein
MREKPNSGNRQQGWQRMADALLLFDWRKTFALFIIWLLCAILTWTVFRSRGGILAMVVAELGATVIPLYLLLALAYTIVRTQPRSRYLRLNPFTLLLIPAVIGSIVLHNLLYATFYPYFQRQGGDEGVFFLLGVIVLPVYFLLVLGYTVITFVNDRREDGEKLSF